MCQTSDLFMGLTGYYKRFIVGFSKIAHPITSLQKKGTKFEWTLKCENNFNLLKELLTSALALNIADPNESFVVCTDTCKEGLGGVLMQNGHVIGYESRKLKEHERNYATHDLELVVIVHSLRMWRHYLMGKKFELRTDHIGLKYLFEQPTLNARQTRWLEFLSEYDFMLVVEPDYLPYSEVFYFQPCLYPMKYLHPRSMYTLPRGGVQRGGTPSAGSGGAIPPAGGSRGKRAPSGGSGAASPNGSSPSKEKLPCKCIL
jgi:hypothetical protein